MTTPRPALARLLRLIPAALALALALGSWAPAAHAKSQKKLRYTFEQVWSAAVRFLRVDEGFAIAEKDADAGYVIFTVAEDGKEFRGTLEIVRIDDDGVSALRLFLGIEDRPAYTEQGILDRLERKLRVELGSPPAPRRIPRPAPDDTGDGDGDGDDKRDAR
ncbi:hypothetical protein [Haliangium ochraceum]|uniref:Uncharacterized protein n=1 Tax=Haliangium ochraceum (strain DSM 14365 / JCM 11303 / SMP-2) TaxID=502025 RepID=D0LW15_HALO1|nr:hypothetical protein [Haliangium ochraceum]ACY15947.1 conserved hypothetical protein [Haliangium ochraceum DSM 14365]